ncbi:winged helix DNA-binding domain-containing protein [uncultured Williamsia sp.]|uniref:winged helix DNA-binding domain-containing protein n=1 Tax=uncultured Williamsia sp. TaxID=259311 RepID=UPI00262EBBE3|nr:winged helix DNA-binding domain-containing protein [uncultured Williamsia sp.]
MPAALTERAWTTTLLERQHLAARIDEDVIEVLDRCVGLQSQDPRAAFVALASRVEGFDPAELDGLMLDRTVVRMALLRSTVFLMDADDARWVRTLAEPALAAELRIHAKRLVTATPEAITVAARDLLDGRSVGVREMGAALRERFPDETVSTLTAIARAMLPLVQVPPRGLWRSGGAVTYALLDDWVGPGEPAVTGDEARKDLIRLYLRGFGPASVAAIQTWAGLTRLRPLLDEMDRDWEVERVTGPDGIELYDLDGLSRDGDRDLPVRLLAPFDHVVTANADRRRVMDDAMFAAMHTPNGRVPGTVLVDGRVVGTWAPGDDGRVTTDLLRPIPATRSRDLSEEVDRMEAFVARRG